MRGQDRNYGRIIGRVRTRMGRGMRRIMGRSLGRDRTRAIRRGKGGSIGRTTSRTCCLYSFSGHLDTGTPVVAFVPHPALTDYQLSSTLTGDPERARELVIGQDMYVPGHVLYPVPPPVPYDRLL